MGRAPCCDKANVKKGPWSPEEDAKLRDYIEKNETGGNWIALPHKAGLKRCGKSCRLRWLNYLRPNIKHGEFTDDEDRIICTLFSTIGSRWSIIAAQLPGRTDNDIKNYWNTKLKKKLMSIIHHNITNSSFISHSHSHTSSSSSKSHLPSNNFLQTCSSNSSSSPNWSDFPAPAFEPVSSFNHLQVPGQDQTSVGSMQGNNFLMFGGGHDHPQASCCSSNSDGSYSNDHLQVGLLQNFNNLYNNNNNGVEDDHQNHENRLNFLSHHDHGMWSGGGSEISETVLDQYGLEEIKQLVSASRENNLLFDDHKIHERVMYY